MDFTYILSGAAVGFIIGLTGVGGGSLMTPLLVLGFNVQPAIAVGTDLFYAAITKSGGVWTHHRLKNIDWSIVKKLGLGSIPGSICCIIAIQYIGLSEETFEELISITLGFMLILTSAAILFKDTISKRFGRQQHYTPSTTLIICLGAALGVLVTLSSVGAGAIGSAILLLLYPRLNTRSIIGTDIAHAVPLTAMAGLGHLQLGHIDFNLLFSLIIGSLPAIYIGTMVGEKLPEKLLKYMLASILLLIGAKFAI
ncbi:MAG: sulfite exporter TauE/SafE family protein [Cycloclasticus sp.]